MNIMAIMFVFHVDTIPYNNRIARELRLRAPAFHVIMYLYN